jgi:hypothetical protein
VGVDAGYPCCRRRRFLGAIHLLVPMQVFADWDWLVHYLLGGEESNGNEWMVTRIGGVGHHAYI